MTDGKIIYNGVEMVPEWPAKIIEAQNMTHYIIFGKQFPRIKYGDEKDDWGSDKHACGDCGVIKGQYHVGPICDVEECPSCSGQVISCDCEYEGDKEDE